MSELLHALTDNIIKDGDFVIVYEGHNQLKSLKLCTNSILHNRYGVFDHNYIINKQYGSKIYNRSNNAYIIVLRCTAELWTNVLLHRTQILYLADISYICYMLQLHPGSIVYESGTGSGSLSTSIVKHIAPTGYLYTFEYNLERVQKAITDFTNLGVYNEYVTVYHNDAVKQGFPVLRYNDSVIGVDAIFLDLPTPWLCIANCHSVLKHGGRICTFSPCIEQTQKTCLALHEHKFQEIRTVEILIANYDVNKHAVIEPDFGQPTTNGTTADNEDNVDTEHINHDNTESADVNNTEQDNDNTEQTNKRQRTDKKQKNTKSTTNTSVMLQSRPYTDQRGHTAYLTFATCYKLD